MNFNYPDSIKPSLIEFVNEFYKISDINAKEIPTSDPYCDFFTSDGTVKMISNVVKGSDAIAEMRKAMWANVTRRKHVVENFGFVSDLTYLINGTVEYDLVKGITLKTEWCGYMQFDKELFDKGELKMSYYQVYLDPTEMVAAISST
ncbi:hypothetical protein CANARDRAFT_9018 [[Candida] arabinofermentans NRRL YB-2248]|uniref:SnoaL-like domain-containing protein n=1 Tax=[Candida] arabinofermentans NRRL YB-2248 TaxID=983967 RepID=A0A1E4SX47_9ASCO|nr:hypothetical protein CANARDRAFT_9018 [[Candida] arabinofermentans NRRL YB-2248]